MHDTIRISFRSFKESMGNGLEGDILPGREAMAKTFGVAVKEQPWAREVSLIDPDGNRLRIGTRKATE